MRTASSLWGLWRSSTVKPRIGENQFGGESITYMGLDLSKKWARIESYGPKLVENITQAISRDILCYAMQTLRTMDIVAHVHDELIIECDERVSLFAVCEQMARTPPWAMGLLLRADGFECNFYTERVKTSLFPSCQGYLAGGVFYDRRTETTNPYVS